MSLLLSQSIVGRRGFLRNAGAASLGIAAASLASPLKAQSIESQKEAQSAAQSKDSVKEILTAALIAEDLATTFYYNALIGSVITDPNLAGPGGTAVRVSAAGNFGNVAYIRAALSEEVSHANYLAANLGIGNTSAHPIHTFYFPAGSFDTLGAFTGLLDALENAFIGAYLNAVQEFAVKSAHVNANGTYYDVDGSPYSGTELDYLAKVAASIMGVECEHRALGRVISNTNPANNRFYEQTDGLNAVYNGPASAVAALTPFLTASTGPAYSWDTAIDLHEMVSENGTAFTPPLY